MAAPASLRGRDAPAPAGAGAASRIGILETDQGLGIYNPARRSWPLILFLLVWLAGWLAGVTFAIAGIRGGPWPVLIFLGSWLAVWTCGGLAIITITLWQLAGREFVFLTPDALVRELRLAGLSWRAVRPLARLSGFAIVPPGRAELLRPGRIAYRDGNATRRLGIGLDEAEISAALRAIEDYVARAGPRIAPAGD